MKKEITAKQAYASIFKLMNKHKELCNFDIGTLKFKADTHLFGLRLRDNYGLDIDPKKITSLDWVNLGNFMAIGLWGPAHGRKISWSDDGRQPESELLLCISFPTGAYILGGDYPEELFKDFYEELERYSPKYRDSHNHSLYFSLTNARFVFNEFHNILDKYKSKYRDGAKAREIQELQAKIEKLKSK